jgi:hypothetical protein
MEPAVHEGRVIVANRPRQARKVVIKETHEPAVPRSWPDGHVAVELTGDDAVECMKITIHGVDHYLHSTTARELSDRLVAKIDEWNIIARNVGIPEV